MANLVVDTNTDESEGPLLGNPNIHQLEIKPKPVLSHEVGAGSPCNRCASCPGLDLHFWRKRCKNCSCRMEDHDVVLPTDHGEIVIGRLFGAQELFEGRTLRAGMAPSPEYAQPEKQRPMGRVVHDLQEWNGQTHKDNEGTALNGGSEPRPVEGRVMRSAPTAQYNVTIERAPNGDRQNDRAVSVYAWLPVGDKRLAEKYMQSLPEGDRPIVGLEGEQTRRKRLAEQVPLFDFNMDAAHVDSEKERETLRRFIDNVRRNVAGIGTVVEVDRDGFLDRAMRGLDLEASSPDAPSNHVHIDENGRRTIEPTDCRQCIGQLKHGDVGVQTEHGTPGDTWHPSCFRCCKCDQLLVDMIYFFHQGSYYCGRHFAEIQYPRCAGCDELIFAREYTLAEEKPWHFDHFACFACDLKLGGHRYVTRDDQPHCLECYLRLFAKTCEACQTKISADEKRLNYGELHWHASEQCFRCQTCERPLIGEKFYLRSNTLYCSAKCKENRDKQNE